MLTYNEIVERPRVVVRYDESPDEPSLDVTTLLHWHSRYGMHSEAVKIDPSDYWSDDDPEGVQRLDTIQQHHELLCMWPLYMYEHGGTMLSVGSGFSCSLDSGQVGFVGMTKEQWAALTDDPWTNADEQRDRALTAIKDQIEILNFWHNGQVFGYVIHGNDGEVIDSCWGFYGSNVDENGMLDYVEEEYHADLREAMERPEA